ncbi:hypothetical protein CFP65_3956 [Kitasatospora sp. MMS16-BH015]|uniref:hypothetical protein n=1 Tax=Kitasatospora sp. MMS16-BH015 TaxID=2018025 RepID=UPI000CA1064F|nr:hypothetical protein [Kitasatospora sp. MMS16-BH015]AUG78726.1 hypothetical protein CFP65_3956 [Kitasatospora sp. MMS16-BH015]
MRLTALSVTSALVLGALLGGVAASSVTQAAPTAKRPPVVADAPAAGVPRLPGGNHGND